MEAQTIDWTLILAGAGLASGLFPLIRLFFRLNINATAFASIVQKLVVAGNLDKAIKLCRAAAPAPLAMGTRAMLEASQGGTRDSLALKEAFEAGAGGLKAAYGKFLWMSILGICLFLAAGGIALAQGLEPAPEHIGLGLGAFIVNYLGIVKPSGIRGQAEDARDAIIESLIARPDGK